MGLKALLERLQAPAADTPDTPEKSAGYQRKPNAHAACTPDTPDTPQFDDSEVTAQSASDLDCWAWPYSDAMNTDEIDTFTARLTCFAGKGLSVVDAERLADKLVIRDRESDDRRLCLECTHMHRGGRCGNWQRAGVAITAWDPRLPAELVQRLQRCDGFTATL